MMMDYWGWDYIFERWKHWVTPSLYVGNMELNVREEHLYHLFSDMAHTVSVHICRDPSTYNPLGYAYVFFATHQDAERALNSLNFMPINGKSIRIMHYYGHDPSVTGVGNIFIKNLDKSIDHEELYYTFSNYGYIVRSKVATYTSGQSKGFGFVQYKCEKSAHNAIEHMNGMVLKDKKLYVGSFLQNDHQGDKLIFVNVVVKQIPKRMTENELNTVFQEFGPTTSCVIKTDDQGRSKRFGYVNFVNPDDAVKAVKALNGKKFGYYKKWFVANSKVKYEMALAMKHRLKNIAERSQSSNHLCVKNLRKTITVEILKELFSAYGTITSCKIMRDFSGVSKGTGFVVFSKPEEASKAMEEINGEMKKITQLYVDAAVIALANATFEQKRTILGENLYPLVEQIEPESAGNITGMILEMDQTQVLHLLESFGALESKVAEAMEILRRTAKEKQQKKSRGVAESPVEQFVSDDLKTVTEAANNSESSLIPKAFNRKLSSSARADKRRRAREIKRQRSRERSAVFLESKATEAVEVVRAVNQQPPHDGGASESPNDPKSSLSPSFISPKPSSLARVNKRLSTRERPDVLLRNRFDSLKENDDDVCTDISISVK